jgi:hypothetical protein
MFEDIFGNCWLKGNLHTHSTQSDGLIPPDRLASVYRKSGYDFLAFTDHHVCSETREEDGFALLSGCEYETFRKARFHGVSRSALYHITGIGFSHAPDIPEDHHQDPQLIINGIHKAGGLAFLAHPAWSNSMMDDIWALEDLDGMEVYNTLSGFELHGDSSHYSDCLSRLGRLLPLLAVDDTHECMGEQTRSFIMVNALKPTRDAILDAMRQRRFYASQGPWLNVGRKGRRLAIHCDPCNEIRICSNDWESRHRVLGSGMRGLIHQMPESATFYRVEVVDSEGRRAWTSPERLSPPDAVAD